MAGSAAEWGDVAVVMAGAKTSAGTPGDPNDGEDDEDDP